MGIPSDDVVVIRLGQKKGDPSVITINCPSQLGLACDIARILFDFGLNVVEADLTTDGRWCFGLFRVTPKDGCMKSVRWAPLKKRLVSVCPSTRPHLFLQHTSKPKPKETFVLQACSLDRPGLLNVVAQALWELELVVLNMKATVSPDGKAVKLFYVNDIREMLHEKRRQDDICMRLKSVLGEAASVEVRPPGPEWGVQDSIPFSNIPMSTVDNLFSGEMVDPQKLTVSLDNSFSPGHTLLEISCKDRRGLFYDCLRVLKDSEIQIAYGRLTINSKGGVDIELFILEGDGKKIVDPKKQKILCSCLEMEIVQPLRVMLANKGPDTELLVASPLEVCGRGRPRFPCDTTVALKELDIGIFKVDVGRHIFNDKKWEIYRFLLMDKPDLDFSDGCTQALIGERVRNILLG